MTSILDDLPDPSSVWQTQRGVVSQTPCSIIIVTMLMMLVGTPSHLVFCAASSPDAAAELNTAMVAHEQAIADAEEPINRAYSEQLTALLKRARQANDIDLTTRIQQILDKGVAPQKSFLGLEDRAIFAGDWVYFQPATFVSYVLNIHLDGTWDRDGLAQGTWTVNGDRLDINFDARADWHDHYTLPIRSGVLQGTNDAKTDMRLIRRGVSLPDAFKNDLVGAWSFYNSVGKNRQTFVLNKDGTMVVDGTRAGFWFVHTNFLFLGYDAHSDWHDVYNLPVAKGELRGMNMREEPLTLTRAGNSARIVPGPGDAPK